VRQCLEDGDAGRRHDAEVGRGAEGADDFAEQGDHAGVGGGLGVGGVADLHHLQDDVEVVLLVDGDGQAQGRARRR
jgi:hypothetical protein